MLSSANTFNLNESKIMSFDKEFDILSLAHKNICLRHHFQSDVSLETLTDLKYMVGSKVTTGVQRSCGMINFAGKHICSLLFFPKTFVIDIHKDDSSLYISCRDTGRSTLD